MQSLNKTERKNSGDIFMPAQERVYHIYAKDRCLFHSLKEEEFNTTWKTLKNMVGLMKTDYSVDDLTYIELNNDKEATLNSSH
jgi:hypothetical protein